MREQRTMERTYSKFQLPEQGRFGVIGDAERQEFRDATSETHLS